MIFGKTKLEMKVGIFVFIGIVILGVFVLSIGGFRTWTKGYHINIIFHFINGVKIGAPVRFAGVDVGEVKDIHVIAPKPGETETTVKVVGWIRNHTRMPQDSKVWVNTLGLLGEKYVEIMPGKDYSAFLQHDQTVMGNDPIAMHEVAQMAKNLVSDIDDGIRKIKNKEGTLGKLLYEDAIYNDLEAFVSDIRKNPWKLFFKTKEKK